MESEILGGEEFLFHSVHISRKMTNTFIIIKDRIAENKYSRSGGEQSKFVKYKDGI